MPSRPSLRTLPAAPPSPAPESWPSALGLAAARDGPASSVPLSCRTLSKFFAALAANLRRCQPAAPLTLVKLFSHLNQPPATVSAAPSVAKPSYSRFPHYPRGLLGCHVVLRSVVRVVIVAQQFEQYKYYLCHRNLTTHSTGPSGLRPTGR